jgi:hypothetical protein
MNPFTKTNLRLGKLQSPGRPTVQPQPTTAEEEAILFGIAEEAPELRPAPFEAEDRDRLPHHE